MNDEWGPWIEHDGTECPCVGEWVQAAMSGPQHARWSHGTFFRGIWEGRARGVNCWVYGSNHMQVVRFRIRKPRGLAILEEIANGAREPVDA